MQSPYYSTVKKTRPEKKEEIHPAMLPPSTDLGSENDYTDKNRETDSESESESSIDSESESQSSEDESSEREDVSGEEYPNEQEIMPGLPWDLGGGLRFELDSSDHGSSDLDPEEFDEPEIPDEMLEEVVRQRYHELDEEDRLYEEEQGGVYLANSALDAETSSDEGTAEGEEGVSGDSDASVEAMLRPSQSQNDGASAAAAEKAMPTRSNNIKPCVESRMRKPATQANQSDNNAGPSLDADYLTVTDFHRLFAQSMASTKSKREEEAARVIKQCEQLLDEMEEQLGDLGEQCATMCTMVASHEVSQKKEKQRRKEENDALSKALQIVGTNVERFANTKDHKLDKQERDIDELKDSIRRLTAESHVDVKRFKRLDRSIAELQEGVEDLDRKCAGLITPARELNDNLSESKVDVKPSRGVASSPL